MLTGTISHLYRQPVKVACRHVQPPARLSETAKVPRDRGTGGTRFGGPLPTLATTLATRTVSIYVRPCPLLSGQRRSPCADIWRGGFGMSAVRNGLAWSVRFAPRMQGERLGNRCSIRLSYGATRQQDSALRSRDKSSGPRSGGRCVGLHRLVRGASCPKHLVRSGSRAESARMTLLAMSPPSRVSWVRQTSPLPPSTSLSPARTSRGSRTSPAAP